MNPNTSAEIAATLEAIIAQPLVIRAALGQPPISIPRYLAEVRRVLKGTRLADFGKGLAALIDDGTGFPTFAELWVVNRLRKAGWYSVWASTYGGLRFIDSWAWNAEKPLLIELPANILERLQRIATIRQTLSDRIRRTQEESAHARLARKRFAQHLSHKANDPNVTSFVP
jgi:hypothetical protein